ncbi:preprotein translocase subunit SecG [Candidatus Dependentiae bacterium]|nr:preprotein translocase subunit SecG [Candidatus Dependentiae bacterium]
MVIFFMILFIILCVLLGFIILIQQGKGDMGLGGLGGGSQMLFGGSGGQDFFEKVTWVMGALFILGALGLTILKYKEYGSTRIKQSSPITQTQEKAKKDVVPIQQPK